MPISTRRERGSVGDHFASPVGVAEENLGTAWLSDESAAPKLPYYTSLRTNGREKPWLVVPYSMETNDARFWRGGLVSVGGFFEYLKETFDCLYQEGREHPKMMSVGLHCRIAGRPARSMAVQRFLEYARGFPNVWFARRDEIARWWLDHYPA